MLYANTAEALAKGLATVAKGLITPASVEERNPHLYYPETNYRINKG